MPELPEVETVKNTLKKILLNKVIKDVFVFYEKIVEYPTVEFVNKIKSNKILDIKRRGKILMFEFADFYMLSHLRMEGKYKIRKIDEAKLKHEHVAFVFDDFKLSYVDTRKFGRMYIVDKDKAFDVRPLNKLGLEIWDDKLNVTYLKNKLNRNLPIKSLLLDQSIITGVGNIYADEILFLAKVNPQKKGVDLNEEEISRIIESTKKTFEKAIELGGTTIRTYESSEGVQGSFQNNLLVHTKTICPVCNEKLIKEKINGRSTYYCNKCQKL